MPKTIWGILGWSGVLPFLALVVLSHWPLVNLPWPPSHIFILYSACILSFLSGSIWLSTSSTKWSSPTSYSNLITLLAFVAALLSSQLSLLILSVGYFMVLLIEFRYELFQQRPHGYKSMRVGLTSVVILSHIILFFVGA